METANLNIHTDKEIKMANVPNSITEEVVEKGRKIAYDQSINGYTDMTDLKAALSE